MPPKARVLIVDASSESRDVLRTLLDHQGRDIVEARQPPSPAEVASRLPIDLIVCDADADTSPDGRATQELAAQASRNHIPIVVLGTIRRDFRPPATSDMVAKPYHYGPLLRKIEKLLGPGG